MTQENHEDLIGLVKEASCTEDDGDAVQSSVHAFPGGLRSVASYSYSILHIYIYRLGLLTDGDTPKNKHVCLLAVSLVS